MHGFDEWHSTEASAPSSTTNCGCDPAWWASSPGCVTGGGAWANRSYACTNYWFPTDVDPVTGAPAAGSACRDATSATREGCVANLTAKVRRPGVSPRAREPRARATPRSAVADEAQPPPP